MSNIKSFGVLNPWDSYRPVWNAKTKQAGFYTSTQEQLNFARNQSIQEGRNDRIGYEKNRLLSIKRLLDNYENAIISYSNSKHGSPRLRSDLNKAAKRNYPTDFTPSLNQPIRLFKFDFEIPSSVNDSELDQLAFSMFKLTDILLRNGVVLRSLLEKNQMLLTNQITEFSRFIRSIRIYSVETSPTSAYQQISIQQSIPMVRIASSEVQPTQPEKRVTLGSIASRSQKSANLEEEEEEIVNEEHGEVEGSTGVLDGLFDVNPELHSQYGGSQPIGMDTTHELLSLFEPSRPASVHSQYTASNKSTTIDPRFTSALLEVIQFINSLNV